MEKMRKNNRKNHVKYDNIDNYFQIKKLSLDSISEFNSFNYYNFDNYIAEETKTYNTELNNQINLDKIALKEELKKIGRFFILENFIEPDQKDNWIELVTQLIEINSTVREDIKEYLLRSSSVRVQTKEPDNNNASRGESRHGSKRTSRATSRKSSGRSSKINNEIHFKIQNKGTKKGGIGNNLSVSTKIKPQKKNELKKKKENSMDNLFDDSSSNLINLKDIKINRFKPPFIWHFPIEKIKELQKKNNTHYEISTHNIDFHSIYKDGRIERFLELFNAVFNSCMKYCQEKLRNNWEYMLYKQYEILDIKYQPFTDKFFRKIDLKPPEPEKEDEIDIDINKEENNGDYKDEVIHTEIEGEN